MKSALALSIFILTLGFIIQSNAETTDAACSAHDTNDSTKCLPSTEQKSNHGLSQEAHAKNSAHGSEQSSDHKDKSKEMNSLFPEKQPIAKLSMRPSAVELVAPKFLSKINGPAKLQWKEAKGANSYHLQVATDPNFKWLVAEEHLLTTTSFDFSNTEAGKKYFWRVAAYNTENESMFTKSSFVSSVFIAR